MFLASNCFYFWFFFFSDSVGGVKQKNKIKKVKSMYNSSLLIDSHFSMLQSYQRMFEFKLSNTFEIIYLTKKKQMKENEHQMKFELFSS